MVLKSPSAEAAVAASSSSRHNAKRSSVRMMRRFVNFCCFSRSLSSATGAPTPARRSDVEVPVSTEFPRRRSGDSSPRNIHVAAAASPRLVSVAAAASPRLVSAEDPRDRSVPARAAAVEERALAVGRGRRPGGRRRRRRAEELGPRLLEALDLHDVEARRGVLVVELVPRLRRVERVDRRVRLLRGRGRALEERVPVMPPRLWPRRSWPRSRGGRDFANAFRCREGPVPRRRGARAIRRVQGTVGESSLAARCAHSTTERLSASPPGPRSARASTAMEKAYLDMVSAARPAERAADRSWELPGVCSLLAKNWRAPRVSKVCRGSRAGARSAIAV